jgi:hypothetical protein
MELCRGTGRPTFHSAIFREGIRNLFLGFLEHLHQRTVESKEGSLLISPTIFDPNHPRAEGKTKRGLQNTVAMRHLWMDFENGDLRPEEIAELFPLTRIAAFNTYNHTIENPRFRVVIPFDKAISAEHYIAMYDNIIAKIVDAGYSVGKSRGDKRSLTGRFQEIPRKPVLSSHSSEESD